MVHVVCTQCGATNRISRDNDAAAGRCGKCGVPLFDGQPADLSTSMLEKQIARSDIPVVVDIWAPWCGPCRALSSILEELALKYAGGIKIVKLNVDENPLTAQQFGVRNIPTMLFFRNGKLVHSLVGLLPKEEIERHLLSVMETN